MDKDAVIEQLRKELEKKDFELRKAIEKLREQADMRTAMLYTIEDVNQALIDIERSKKEWEATFDSISDPLFIHDKDMRLAKVNMAYLSASGEAKFKNIIGKRYYEVFPKMDAPFKMCLNALELQEEEEILLPAINKVFKVRFYPIKDENGGHLYSIHILEDITEAKKAEEELRLRAKLLDSTSDSICLVDLNGNFIYLNEAAWKSRGYTRDELMGMNLHILDTPEYEKIIEARFRELMEKGHSIFESAHRCKDGSVMPIEISARLIEAGGRRVVLSAIRDITERKKSEERIKEEMETTSHLLMIAEATAHTTDIDKLMEQVVHCGHEIIKCDACLSYLWDDEARVLRPSECHGLAHEMIPVFRTGPLDEKAEFVRKAMEAKEPLVVQLGENPPQSPFYKGGDKMFPPLAKGGEGGFAFSWLPDINTIAVIPLSGKEGPLGLIVGIYKNPPVSPFYKGGDKMFPPLAKGGKGGFEFTERNIKVMRGIMNQVSVALEQARLYTESVNNTLELSHKIETIKVMNEIDRSILSTLRADELLETVTRLIAKVIPCERATVSLVDMERGGFIYKAGFGTAAVPKGAFVSFADTSARGIFETGRTEYVNNLSEMRQLLPLEKKFLDEGFLAHIRVPITLKGDVAGVLTVGAKKVAAFTKENLSTLEYLCSQIGVALSNAGLISDLEELFISVVKSLSSAIDAKSPWTAGHSERVTKYALDIAKQMGLSEKELKDLELAGLLHDVGKIGTYESILDKPGKLTDEERAIMRQHPAKGAEILAPIKQLKDIIPDVKYHHEFYDGTGYPDGLKGEAIPLHARILTVADTVDAMGADRPYREGRAMDVIIAELKRCSGTQFDPKVAEAFLKVWPQKGIV